MRYLLPFFLPLLILLMPHTALSQDSEETEVWEPAPPVVEPADRFLAPPDDAIVLFDGSDLGEWSSMDGSDAGWELSGGAMTVVRGTGDIRTRRSFGDLQLYLEWRAPAEIVGEGQGRGNSGVFLQNRYEVQVLDNWNNPTYVNGMAGSVYKQHIPLANPAKRPGEWQTYEIYYRAPRFSGNGDLEEPARVTVVLNGVLIQNNVEIFGNTVHLGLPYYEVHGPAPIRLQNHGGDRVSYRNIWVRELDPDIMDSDGVTGR